MFLGNKGGIIRLLEVHHKRPFQWIICLLHFNELPLRALFLHLDGKTTGPNNYSGKIGKLLGTCDTLPVVAFKSINCSLSIENGRYFKNSKKSEHFYI